MTCSCHSPAGKLDRIPRTSELRNPNVLGEATAVARDRKGYAASRHLAFGLMTQHNKSLAASYGRTA